MTTDAARALFEQNENFAYHLAHYYRSAARTLHVNFQDVRQAALTGLWRAALRFDPGRGVRFVTYAAWYIRGEIFAMFSDAKRREQGTFTGNPQHARPLLDALPAAEPVPALEWPGGQPDLGALLSRLPQRERALISAFCGLEGEERSLADLGRQHGLTRQRVHQLVARGLQRLRDFLVLRAGYRRLAAMRRHANFMTVAG